MRTHFGSVSQYSIRKLNIPLTFQSAKISIYKTVLPVGVKSVCFFFFFTLKEEHKLQVFGNKITIGPMRDGVTEQFRIMHNEKLCSMYRSGSSV
jgi:hypothetical protein